MINIVFHHGKSIFRASKNYIIQGRNTFISKSRSIELNLIHVQKYSCLSFTRIIMSKVCVKNVADDDRLQINVDLKTPDGSLKSFKMYRLKTEEHGVALERLRLNLSKKMSKKKKKKTSSDDVSTCSSELVPLDIFRDGEKLLATVENELAWIEGATLRYGEEDVSIACNLPLVKLEKFPTVLMAGFPLFPLAEFEFCEMESCEFYWKMISKDEFIAVNANIGLGKIIELNDTFDKVTCYTPNASDIGRHILIVCVPKNSEKEGKPEARLSEASVQSGPSVMCPFEKRHEFTKARSKQGEFRVVSYNLLADIYSRGDDAYQAFFSYCPREFVNMDYRKHLLLKEIAGYQADLLCFQEVDKSIFTSHLAPALKSLGYDGLLRVKSGGQSCEGCATFVRSDKFRIVNQLDIVLSEFLAQDPSCQDIWDKVKAVEPLKEDIEQRSTILQVTVVESMETPNKYVCLANTHFYFHPTAGNVRLLHAATALRHLQNICASYEQEGKTMAVVFCGDFNSLPHSAVFQLFSSQFVPTEHVDWSSRGKEETLTDLELCHSMSIESACGCPDYTHYLVTFKNTLDYIFIDASKLQTTAVVPMIDHADVTANIALPSVVIPSDHLALVCDIKFVVS